MIKRIKSLISVKNLTASQFADLLGVQRSNISHILSGRNKPSLDFVLKIAEHFPIISMEWLINGNGEMFKTEEKGNSNKAVQLEFSEIEPQKDEIVKPIEIEKKVKLEDDVIVKREVESILSTPISETEKGEDENVPTPSISAKDIEIERIMILYKNGSFRMYTPQK